MSCTYRRWTLDDLPSVRSVTWTTWLDTYAPFIPVADLEEYFSRHYTTAALEQLLRDPCVNGFVAEMDGRIVGYLKTQYVAENHRLFVSSVYVLPEAQGHRIGATLMQMAEEEARSRGVGEYWLGVMNQNTRALAWYVRLGFEFLEELPFTLGSTTVLHTIGRKMFDGASGKRAPRPSGDRTIV